MTEKPPPGPQCSTTFVQADATTFKELVQRLTGPHEEPQHHHHHIPSPPRPPDSKSAGTGCKRPTFKLHERRHGARSKLTIVKPNVAGFESSPGASPSQSKKSVSPSTRMSNLDLNEEEEEKAIKERRFYLHPSPRSRYKGSVEPELLQLFPLTSPTQCPGMNPILHCSKP